jgi:hypothetical protein
MADALGRKAIALVAVAWCNIACAVNGSCTARWPGFSRHLAASAYPVSCCVTGVKSAFTALSVSNVPRKNSSQEPLAPGTAFAHCWRETVRSTDAPVSTACRKNLRSYQASGIALALYPWNACVAGKKQPAGGGHGLRRPFSGTSRTRGEPAAVLPGEEDNDAAPRNGDRMLTLGENGIGDKTGERRRNS